MLQPYYACAIIRVGDAYLLEQRGADAQFAANKLTCFGGRRETDEDSQTCLRRELQEELGWQPNTLSFACSLWQDQRFIAEFFHCELNVDVQELNFEQGRNGILVTETELAAAQISPWHRAVFDAVHQNINRVNL